MITKIYEEGKKILKENYKFLLFLVGLFLLFTVKLPYYINCPGGLINVTSKVEVEDGYESKGSFNLAYVTELKATIPTLIFSYFNQDWDILKKEDIAYDNETLKDADFRNHLLLEEANSNAMIVAYNKAGKDYKITKEQIFVTYVDENALTGLKVRDEIISIAGRNVKTKEDVALLLKEYQVGDLLTFKIKRDGEWREEQAEIIEEKGKKKIGIMLSEKKIVETDPVVSFHFSKAESGPSGGFMMTLAIYNQLIPKDLTRGKVIVGTGTIDLDGNVGSIGGIAYKLKGAMKKKADIFFVPAGENYKDALALKKERNYKIELVPITKFDDAITYLESLSF